MNDTASLLFTGLLFSSAGLGYFIYGKRQHHRIALLAGIALMVYPYFITSLLPLVAIGVLLMLSPKLIRID